MAAQSYWARNLSGLGNAHVADVQVDADGAIYITGAYGGSGQFGGQSFANAGGLDAFVARLDPMGGLVWFIRGGGAGGDRGIKLSVGGGGTLAVAGEFMGSANLFGEALTSAGGTADVFTAVLAKSDGALQWIRQGGGATGSDSPGAVSMGPGDVVAVAGQFRGTAQWGGSTLVSITDPQTALPSADVFVANYSATGELLWLKHGAADKEDEAVDAVHDAAGNLYVTGQYSNTITFDQAHPNILQNASFLMQLGPDGSEAWFRRMGGAGYNHVRGLAPLPGGGVAVVGDQQGTMVWTGTGTVSIPAALAYAYYLLMVDPAGQLSAHTTVASTSGLTVRDVAVQANAIAVLGAFTCQFTDLSLYAGSDALFMATGTEDLFIAVHGAGTLALQQAQQYGGRSAKEAGGVAFLPQGELVFSGSYQQNLVFPASGMFSGDAVPYGQGGGGIGVADWCGASNYGTFAGLESTGLTDGFIARGHVQGRAPYDWWIRSAADCSVVRNEPCILAGSACGDTLVACGQAGLNVDLRLAYSATPGIRYVGPPLTYHWSTGATTPALLVSTSGTYGVEVSSANGCWQWTDSIVVVINPLPPVTWLSFAGGAAHGPPFGIIHLCDPETSSLEASNLPVGGTWWWDVPFNPDHVPGNYTLVDTTGVYAFHAVTAMGCERITVVGADDSPTVPMPDIGLQMAIHFPQDSAATDTLGLCPGLPVQMQYVPEWTIDGLPAASLPDGLTIRYCIEPCTLGSPVDAGPQLGYYAVAESGWMVFDVKVTVDNAPCAGDTLVFHGLDSIYVNIFPPLNVAVQLTGPASVCDGDTVLLTASCTGCTALSWWATGAGQPVSDTTFQAWAPGQFGITGSAMDGNGCAASQFATHTVATPAGPVLSVLPPGGILCPGDSAVITAGTAGTDAVWYGPLGAITGQGTALTTDVPGSYYVAMLVEGCPVTSNSATITGYGTPYLSAGAGAALCFPGDETELEVMTVPGAVVHWNAPLSGNATVQAVGQPGTYTCSVTACGIVTPLSIEVAYAPAHAQLLTPGPLTLCPGDSLLLQAGAGADSYTWLPGAVPGPTLTVFAGGSYRLLASNVEGCTDTSAAVVVDQFSFSVPLAAAGDTVCAGDAAVLIATGSGLISWYANAAGGTPLGSGSPFLYAPPASTTIHVRQSQGGCTSAAVSVQVVVKPRPPAVLLTGPDSLCVGDAFAIVAAGPDSLSYHWATPGGTVEGPGLSIGAVGLGDMGNYACVPVFDGCNGPAADHLLAVYAPEPLGFPGEMPLCEGGAVTLEVPASFGEIHWSNGSTAASLTLVAPADLTVQAVDRHGCPAQAQVVVVVEDCELVIPNIFSPNGDGSNDQWFILGGFVKADARVWNRWGNLVFVGDLMARHWSGRHYLTGNWCSDGTYFFEMELLRSDGAGRKVAGSLLLTGAGR